MKMKIFLHEKMGPWAEFSGNDAERYSYFLGGVLWGNFKNIQLCEFLLEKLEKFERGDETVADWEGQSWQIDIEKESIRISFQLDLDTNSLFTFDEFKHALKAWTQFLKSNPTRSDIFEVEI